MSPKLSPPSTPTSVFSAVNLTARRHGRWGKGQSPFINPHFPNSRERLAQVHPLLTPWAVPPHGLLSGSCSHALSWLRISPLLPKLFPGASPGGGAGPAATWTGRLHRAVADSLRLGCRGCHVAPAHFPPPVSSEGFQQQVSIAPGLPAAGFRWPGTWVSLSLGREGNGAPPGTELSCRSFSSSHCWERCCLHCSKVGVAAHCCSAHPETLLLPLNHVGADQT